MSANPLPASLLSIVSHGRSLPLSYRLSHMPLPGHKSLVVRYITRRYIGEYDPSLEKIYPHTALVDQETVAFDILDSAGVSHESDSVRLETNIRWADLFLLMYSVTDKCSFDDCNRLKFLINYNKRKRRISSPTSKDGSWEVPVVLVGNKKDQLGDRMVTLEEGRKRSKDIGCHAFHEISVRESIEEVSKRSKDIGCHAFHEISIQNGIEAQTAEWPDVCLGLGFSCNSPSYIAASPVLQRLHNHRYDRKIHNVRLRAHLVTP
ncbi:unnamed protein product, partial [Meganyctiphanes norvegica]